MSRIELDDPRLTAYVLNELSPADRAAVEAAADADPQLRAELASLKATIGMLAAELGREPAPELTPAQRKALELRALPDPLRAREPAGMSWAGWLTHGLVVAGFFGLIMSAGVGKYQSSSEGARRRTLQMEEAERAPHAAPAATQPPQQYDVSRSNQYALLPRGQSPADRGKVERELAPKPDPAQPGNPPGLAGDLRRSAVDLKTPYYGLRGAASEIHGWVRGGEKGLASRLRSNNDYYCDYSRGYPAGGYHSSGAPPSAAASASAGMQQALTRYQAAERAGDAAAASRALKDYTSHRDALRDERSSDGYDIGGFDRQGFDRDGYDRAGRDRHGYDRAGYDRGGFDPAGHDRRGELARPAEPSYEPLAENAFVPACTNPLSTFSIDVDTASYSKVRRYLTEGSRPPADAVRIEELINYFPYSYPEPDAGEPLTVAAEVAGAPWTPGHRLVRVALKARSIAAAQRPASNLVFLIDVSGSMDQPDRLPLVQRSLEMLVPQLGGEDRVAIVVYAGSSGLVLPSTPGDRKERIVRAVRDLRAGGSTNGGAGIELAYRTVQESFIKGGNNRVVLATDGDFNVGVTSRDALEALIRKKAKSGVFLSVLGYGMGNHQDATLERLADRGNGNHAYIDTLAEAHKVLVEQMAGTLVAVARDVKIQVEFDPAHVASYRLIGYENRALAAEDFTDDTKDAGELGAGHTVIALYEIVPAGAGGAVAERATRPRPGSEGARSAPTAPPMLTVKVRHQPPTGGPSRELKFPVTDRGAAFESGTADFRWAAAVAAFGMELRGSRHRGNATLGQVRAIAAGARGADPSGYRAEFIELVKRAASLR